MSSPRYLLDTNAISELRKKQPDRRVLSFFSTVNSESLLLSVLSIGELHKGAAIKKLTDPEGARRLIAWIDGIEQNFGNRILPIDAANCKIWGDLSAHRSRPVIDTLIAATAIVHDLILVTRNTRDIRDIPHLNVLNPWKD